MTEPIKKQLMKVLDEYLEKEKHHISGRLYMASKAGFENNGMYDEFKQRFIDDLAKVVEERLEEYRCKVIEQPKNTATKKDAWLVQRCADYAALELGYIQHPESKIGGNP